MNVTDIRYALRGLPGDTELALWVGSNGKQETCSWPKNDPDYCEHIYVELRGNKESGFQLCINMQGHKRDIHTTIEGA
jgi:hypothetical protein